jgi:hypothetical protein
MECENCLTHIEAYLDGELDAHAAREVASHLSLCGECASYFEELQAEQSAYAHYRRDVDVTPAMWAAVEARIGREKIAAPRPDSPERVGPFARLREWLVAALGAPRLSPACAAALVVAAVGLTIAVMIYMKQDGAGQRPELARGGDDPKATAGPDSKQAPGGGLTSPSAPSPSPDEVAAGRVKQPPATVKPPRVASAANRETVAKAQTPEQLVREAEQKYLAAIALVERDVKRRRERLDPALMVKLDNALASIDLTIEETRRAVREHPGDPVALQYLLGAYSKKIDALREMARE